MTHDAIVIGAGLAGLRCAAALREAGRDVVVLDAADDVGGRIRTDVIDGFRCDRGFQVLNPSYPAVQRWVDVARLGLQQFSAGLLVRTASRLTTLADPLRLPSGLPRTLVSGLLDAGDLAALARWLAPVMIAPQRSAHGRADTDLRQALDTAGVDGRLRVVIERFLAGVLVDSTQASSADFVRLLLRSFALGRPGLPFEGMAALPRQLASALDIQLDSRVTQVDGEAGRMTVRTETDELGAAVVVIAADPAAAASLTDRPAPPMKGLTTWWFASDEPPDTRALLAIDGRPGPDAAPPGPVWNAAVVSAAAPSYAPPRRSLIEATTLLDRPDGDASESDVKTHLAAIYGCDTRSWEVVTRHRIERALPSCPPPLRLRRPLTIRPGMLICGDHTETPSIQGALVSGQRAAEAVLAR